MLRKHNKNANRMKRHLRSRTKIIGTNVRPRLNVYRSLSNIYAQIIDDESGKTLVAASSLEKDIAKSFEYGGNTAAAKAVGEAVANRAKEKGITKVVFDRGGHIYHGRIAALAEAARAVGLEF